MSMLDQLKNRSASTGATRPTAVKAPAPIKSAVSAPSPAALVRKAQAPRMAAPSSNNRQLVKPKQQQTTNAGAMARRQGTSVARQNDRYDNEYYDDESDDSEEEEEEYDQPRNKRSQRRLGSDRAKGESKGFTFVNNGFMGAPGTTMTDLGNDYKDAKVLKGNITNHYNVASPPSTEPSLSQAFSNF